MLRPSTKDIVIYSAIVTIGTNVWDLVSQWDQLKDHILRHVIETTVSCAVGLGIVLLLLNVIVGRPSRQK